MIHLRLKRRLTAAAITFLLIAAPTIWVAWQYRQVKLDRALIAAIKRSDTVDVDALLAAGADPNTRDVPEARRSFIDSFRELFHHLSPDKAQTALMKAADSRVLRIVKALIASGADANAKDQDGSTALMRAAYYGNADTIHTLAAAHAQVNFKDNAGDTALIWAAQRCNAENVKALIAVGADVNQRDKNRNTALMLAEMTKDESEAAMLRKAGAKE